MIWLAIRNVLVLVVFVAAGGIYYGRFAGTISQEWILVVNFVLLPGMVGISTYFLFGGRPFTRVALVSAIPILSIALAGGDPAKPGMELGLMAPLLVICWVGAGISYALQRFTARNSSGPSSA